MMFGDFDSNRKKHDEVLYHIFQYQNLDRLSISKVSLSHLPFYQSNHTDFVDSTNISFALSIL